MAPTFEERYILKNLKSYMRQASQDQISRHYASLAKCPEFRSLFLYLADKSPAAILRLVKMVLEKFGYKLNAKKGSRTTRKRAKLPVCHERNAKRHKIVHAAEAGTGQQDAEDDDDHEVLTKKETPNPHNNIELSDSVTHVGEYQENMCVEPTNYEVESGLASRKPIIETFVRASLLALNPGLSGPNSRTHEEITNVWRIIHLLEFFTTRSELHQHLESRENTSRHLLLAPIDWDMSEPSEILDALDNVKRSTTDNKIHRAYGQAMLVGSVDAKVARGYKSTIGNYRSSHKALLEELARDKAGSLSVMEQDQMIASCFYEYSAGQKWLAVMDWFGGSGIVLVFVVAGELMSLPCVKRHGF